METGEDVLAYVESASGSDGGFSSTNESQSGVAVSCSASGSPYSPGKDEASSKRSRKVSFPDDSCLVHSLEPFDPWKNGKF
jgi:hypothetical protein